MDKIKAGERVKVRGTSIFGEVVRTEAKYIRSLNRNNEVFVVMVKLENGGEMEYTHDELIRPA